MVRRIEQRWMKILWIIIALPIGLGFCLPGDCASEADQVVVVFNSRMSESKAVAEYYAYRRQIPASQVFGFDLPTTETMTRKEFRDDLARPLFKKLEKTKLISIRGELRPVARETTWDVPPVPIDSKVRYVTLCYGVPLKILNDPKLSEPGADRIQEGLRKNEAAVDNELALLPGLDLKLPAIGPLANRLYATTNAASLNPANGLLLVARLDGPTPEIARGLVDKAIQAETEGLWGRAYFDSRGLTNGNTKVGDDWIKGAAEVTRRLGFETVLDLKDERFPVSFPMSQIAFYAGWYEYDGQVSGPFTRPTVEFMPGAFAYHLHSFSALTLRSASQNWAGPLLAKGATATMGSVNEPYLELTPNIAVFFHRLIHLGFSFGEAAYASQSTLSWQTTVVGDPLYRPFAKKPQKQHEELLQRKSKLLEWSHLKVVNINLATDLPATELVHYLETMPGLGESPVLLEKLGDLYLGKADFLKAVENYRKAAKCATSRQQQVRLLLAVGRSLELFAAPEEVYEAYREFVRAFPEYPDLGVIYRKLLLLADQLKKASDRDQFQREIERLGAPNRAKS